MPAIMKLLAVASGILLAGIAYGGPAVRQAGPTVKLDDATFTGANSGLVNKFLGIPFAQPPVGNLRFRLPQTIPAYNGTHTATAYGPSCPQQDVNLVPPDNLAANSTDFLVNTIFHAVFPDSEDCLTVNVVAPVGATPSSKLPVAAWIFGGGFELGATSMYDGSVVVEKSIALGEPVVYVSMNYRVSGWGFLASQEVKDAGVGNLGLQDQREAFRWIQKYIGAFGGDPSKVTIWGESAGAISVALHMVANGGDTEGLFRGGFMQSGSPIPVGDITHGQGFYDQIVADTGCSGASDTLQCLREVSADSLRAAINKTPGIFAYRSLSLAWLPRADGVFLAEPPQQLVEEGKVASIPMVNGDCDDEGTLFSFSTLNITTTAQLKEYIQTYFLPRGDPADIDRILELYPEDVTQGSPFNTGIIGALTPQNKRIAALLGDVVFQAPRRFFLQQRSGKQNIWSYVNKRLKSLPSLGAFHGSDILNAYGGGDITDWVVNFVNHLDPNGLGSIPWPQYTTGSPNMMTLLDGLIPQIITQDTYRAEPIATLTEVTLENPI